MMAYAPPHSLWVFYRDYTNRVTISSAQPESLAADRVAPLAERLLVDADNFLGVVDRDDTILQCYLADDQNSVVLEIVYPEASGCLRLCSPREQALTILRGLPETFDESLLRGAQYVD